MRLNKIYTTTLAVLLFILLLFFGWKREDKLLVISQNGFKFLNKYPKTEITNYTNEVSNLATFHLSPKLQSSIFFSLIYTVLSYLVLVFLFSRQILRKNISRFLFIIHGVMFYFYNTVQL